jgi:hypothetical protein
MPDVDDPNGALVRKKRSGSSHRPFDETRESTSSMHVSLRSAAIAAFLIAGAALPAWADEPATKSAAKPAAKTSSTTKSRKRSKPSKTVARYVPSPCPEGYSCKTGSSGQRYRWKPGFC